MDCYSDHSAILDYLAQVEQEDQLRESLKSKSGIAALRVEKGDCCDCTANPARQVTDLVDEFTSVEACNDWPELTWERRGLDCAMYAKYCPLTELYASPRTCQQRIARGGSHRKQARVRMTRAALQQSKSTWPDGHRCHPSVPPGGVARAHVMYVTTGSGPYRKWEKQPLCDELGEASSSSHEDDYIDKGHCDGPIISKKTMQYLIWFNAALFILVVLGGTLMVSSLTRAYSAKAGRSCSRVVHRLTAMCILQHTYDQSDNSAKSWTCCEMLCTNLRVACVRQVPLGTMSRPGPEPL